LLESGEQVDVAQAHSAGADRMLGFLPEVLRKLDPVAWEKGSLVFRNDVGVRKLEGMNEETPKVAKNGGADLAKARIRVRSAVGGKPLLFQADLLEGQKTGFFLDQAGNIAAALAQLKGFKPKRILDLCCYVGQWGAQFASLHPGVEVTGVDASASALELARKNVEAAGGQFKPLKADVLHELKDLPEKSFDLVICDPPALIKGRKDIPQGKHAYLQLNTQAIRLLAEGGAFVSCSCSALLEEEDFAAAIHKAASRNSRDLRFVARGGQAPDHPFLAEFPEGRYLKCWVGLA
jgi:23S rRNA (cytosine1962-C5)-methyltransferase